MTTFIHQNLESILNQCMREITKRFAGIDLLEEEAALSDDICTVHTVLEGNQRAALLLSADTPLLIRLAQHIMHSQTVTQQDIEDVATEYFNVICGRIAAGLFQSANIASRFQTPKFFPGPYLPEESADCRCELNYTDGNNQTARLICVKLIPAHPCPSDKAG